MTVNLYIKQHRLTGLRYFGKTKRKDVDSYSGSGLYWKRHLKIHGRAIDTIWSEQFDNLTTCQEFAEFFSDFFDIVADPKWANVKPENGLDGWPAGTPNPRSVPQSEETRAKKSAALKGYNFNNSGERNHNYGKPMPEARKEKMRATKLNNPTAVPWTAERRAKVAATWAVKKAQQEQQ